MASGPPPFSGKKSKDKTMYRSTYRRKKSKDKKKCPGNKSEGEKHTFNRIWNDEVPLPNEFGFLNTKQEHKRLPLYMRGKNVDCPNGGKSFFPSKTRNEIQPKMLSAPAEENYKQVYDINFPPLTDSDFISVNKPSIAYRPPVNPRDKVTIPKLSNENAIISGTVDSFTNLDSKKYGSLATHESAFAGRDVNLGLQMPPFYPYYRRPINTHQQLSGYSSFDSSLCHLTEGLNLSNRNERESTFVHQPFSSFQSSEMTSQNVGLCGSEYKLSRYFPASEKEYAQNLDIPSSFSTYSRNLSSQIRGNTHYSTYKLGETQSSAVSNTPCSFQLSIRKEESLKSKQGITQKLHLSDRNNIPEEVRTPSQLQYDLPDSVKLIWHSDGDDDSHVAKGSTATAYKPLKNVPDDEQSDLIRFSPLRSPSTDPKYMFQKDWFGPWKPCENQVFFVDHLHVSKYYEKM